MCLGDSFTWGWGVEQNDIYTRVLENALKDRAEPWEVVNAGVGGYSTDHLLLYLRRQGRRISPNVVIYQVAKNDVTAGNTLHISEGIYQKPFFRLLEDGCLSLENCPVPPLLFWNRMKYAVSRHSRLAYFLKHRIHAAWLWRRSKYVAQKVPTNTEESSGAISYSFRLFAALVSELQSECDLLEANMVLLIDFPFSEEELDYWRDRCAAVNTHFLVPYFERRERETNISARIPNDGHWSKSGHQWVAEYVASRVITDVHRQTPTVAGGPGGGAFHLESDLETTR